MLVEGPVASPADAGTAPPRDSIPPYRVPPNVQKKIDQGAYAAADSRFPGNRFLELKALRPSMRAYSIKHRLIADPEHRTDLTGAITVVGTCMDMCPEYERHEREFQKDVDDWEKIPGTNPKRIDHARAVKKYRRSAAGNDEPLESDLRPPSVLKMTLDYLFNELLQTHGLEATYAFIRDRTRAIRTDFTIQHEKGPLAIECFERIARFHILALHHFCEREDITGFDYWQEVEQMMKTLQSLMQFYDDNEGRFHSPNEAEFRSYYILVHIRDTKSIRRLQSLPLFVFLDPVLQAAIEFRSHAQRNTHVDRRRAAGKFRNSEACLNAFTRFFKRVKHPGTSYLMACLVEYHFGAVRKGAVHALWKAYTSRHRPFPTSELTDILGTDSEEMTLDVTQRFGMISAREEDSGGTTTAVHLNKNSKFDYANQISQRYSVRLVELKRNGLTDLDIVDGRFDKAGQTWNLSIYEEPTVVTPPSPVPIETEPPQQRQSPSEELDFTQRYTFEPTLPIETFQEIPRLPDFIQRYAFEPTPTIEPFRQIPQLPDFTQRYASESAPTIEPFRQIPQLPDFTKYPVVEPSPSNEHLPQDSEEPTFTQYSPPEPAIIPTSLPASPNVDLQKTRRATALAKAKADRYFKFRLLFTFFTHWKQRGMDRAYLIVAREDQRARFRRSIQNIGFSTNSPDGDRNATEREVVMKKSTRKPRKSVSRADDEATIAAIKNSETMRIKLWERGTFLSSVTQHLRSSLPRKSMDLFSRDWQVWLSTAPDNPGVAEWLRVKFSANELEASKTGAYKISLQNATTGLPAGHGAIAGLIAFDLSISADQSTVIHSDRRRLLCMISELPAKRRYLPSIILFRWTESEELYHHMSSLLDNLRRHNIIYSWRTISFSNDGRHYDDQFSAQIQSIPLDTSVERPLKTIQLDGHPFPRKRPAQEDVDERCRHKV